MTGANHPLTGNFHVPAPENEPVHEYRPGSPEALSLQAEIKRIGGLTQSIPLSIGGKVLETSTTQPVVSPHDHRRVLGQLSLADESHVRAAIDASLEARHDWSRTPWFERVSIFLRAAELMTGKYRDEVNAATMLNQSKTYHQSEIDGVCELADLIRFNAHYAEEIYTRQPKSTQGEQNYLDQRGLEGFVLAVSPFNFTNIAGNLPAMAAMMGNTVVWKPSEKSALSTDVVRRIFEEAGVPPGVINCVHGHGKMVTDIALADPNLAGLSFVGSTQVFRELWKKVANNIDRYKGYPRVVGETGGKNAIIAHPSADVQALLTGMTRGAFEFQGQKCSAASRAYIPRSIWTKLKDKLAEQIDSLVVGDVADHSTFLGAVIDEAAHDRLAGAIERANSHDDHTLIAGGTTSKETGYFVRPTVFETTDPASFALSTEFFGPLLTVYVYDDKDWTETLKLADRTSQYGLTASVYANDRKAVAEALDILRDTSGYLAINDKPAGMSIGKQQFAGARASGTNDKIGSPLALQRWVSGRFVKENLAPDTDYRYPYMGA
ncbi:L-glutamate gamma-semialdehyde dehydrogenase [Streptomyces mutabilis]|uniref:L-glutamate gamma-semialdehyde dehydrogenase n=1 Tax=Streptomyces mutabilis TaxID=67332 RepID=A0A086MQP3_9ACTN|nr:L-glutamate gamma-semialdehyde dehydrogenase [Streptomyces mutabilis]KFG71211.1 1-pyrroline-5-carboxylate dehydrogenase [Streptomyces mutabilis]